jgi:hypothetical protein
MSTGAIFSWLIKLVSLSETFGNGWKWNEDAAALGSL